MHPVINETDLVAGSLVQFLPPDAQKKNPKRISEHPAACQSAGTAGFRFRSAGAGEWSATGTRRAQCGALTGNFLLRSRNRQMPKESCRNPRNAAPKNGRLITAPLPAQQLPSCEHGSKNPSVRVSEESEHSPAIHRSRPVNRGSINLIWLAFSRIINSAAFHRQSQPIDNRNQSNPSNQSK